MATAEVEMKANLADLSKIPAKDFEKHFRDWMERDDVARALQAKLRTDLITNFNKTSLGRQIVSQTTSTTTGGSKKRLTLSPLVLALNTLVAEFLYAQNCHFSLSVFCTEVPFRNTLPDFETAQQFRFTEDEIMDILEAVTGRNKCESHMKQQVAKKYGNSKTVSLLILVVRYLLRQVEETEKRMTALKTATITAGTQTTVSQEQQCNVAKAPLTLTRDTQTPMSPSKKNIHDSNIRYLNKYLIALSKRVKEMSDQFDDLQQNRVPLPRIRITKSVRTRRYENLNRSLEHITEQLKRMIRTKTKSKQVGSVVNAIEALTTQFNKCAANFDSVSRELMTSRQQKREYCSQEAQTLLPAQRQAEVQVSTTSVEVDNHAKEIEKTYTEWVHEMRNTKNGQKFLDRIEASLRKALHRHRDLLKNESELKMRRQKELLKIHYKQKLMDYLTRQTPYDFSEEAKRLNESIGEQLRQFEVRHAVLLQQISSARSKEIKLVVQNADTNANQVQTSQNSSPMEMGNAKQSETQTNTALSRLPSLKSVKPSENIHLANFRDTQKELKVMVENIAQQERSVDQIIYDAKLRINELENESNQLELNFRNYLERQRLQTDTMREVVASLTEDQAKDRPKISDKYAQVLENLKPHADFRRKESNRRRKEEEYLKTLQNINSISGLLDQENQSPNRQYRNAIREAKEKLFKNENSSQYTSAAIKESDEDFNLRGVQPYYYNTNFGRFESRSNLLYSKLDKHFYTSKVQEEMSVFSLDSVATSSKSSENYPTFVAENAQAVRQSEESIASVEDFDMPLQLPTKASMHFIQKSRRTLFLNEKSANVLKDIKQKGKEPIINDSPTPFVKVTEPGAATAPMDLVIVASTSADAAAGIVTAGSRKHITNTTSTLDENGDFDDHCCSSVSNKTITIHTNEKSKSNSGGCEEGENKRNADRSGRQARARERTNSNEMNLGTKPKSQGSDQNTTSTMPLRATACTSTTSLTLKKTMQRMTQLFERPAGGTATIEKTKRNKTPLSPYSTPMVSPRHYTQNDTSRNSTVPLRQMMPSGTGRITSPTRRYPLASGTNRMSSPTSRYQTSNSSSPMSMSPGCQQTQRGSSRMSSSPQRQQTQSGVVKYSSQSPKPCKALRCNEPQKLSLARSTPPRKQLLMPTKSALISRIPKTSRSKPVSKAMHKQVPFKSPKKRSRQAQPLNTFTISNENSAREQMKKSKTNFNIVVSEQNINVPECNEENNLDTGTQKTLPQILKNAVQPTISSTTFALNYDDAISESSIEIAAMVASSEKLELADLVVEEDEEEDGEEELEPFGKLQTARIEDVSDDSSYTDVAPHIAVPLNIQMNLSRNENNFWD